MNSRKSLYDIAEFYRKNAVLNASYHGMRYRIQRETRTENEQESHYLVATIWPEPFCYEKTPEEKREQKAFPYAEESLDQIYDWLCLRYEQNRKQWEQADITFGNKQH